MNFSLNRNPSTEAPASDRSPATMIWLWLSILGAPTAWVAQLLLSEPFAAYACYPHQVPLSKPIFAGLTAILATISIACLALALLSGFAAWISWWRFESKPSPEGEGWVRGNQNKERSLFNPPHPNLIMPDSPVRHPAGECKSAPGGFVPQGEGARTVKPTLFGMRGEDRNRFLVKIGILSSFIFIVAVIFNIFAVLLVPPCSSWF